MSDELAELQARYDRLHLLYQVSQGLHASLDPQEALQRILGEAVRLMRASSGSVALVNPTTGFLEIEAAHDLPANAQRLRLRVGEGITGWVAQTGRTVRASEVAQDAHYIELRPGVRSELAVPLLVDGEVRGVLNVDSDRPGAFTRADQDLLEELAIPAAAAIRNSWLYEQIRLKARLFEALVKVGQTINSTLNLAEGLAAITREACALLSAKVASLLLLDSSRALLELKACHGAGGLYRSKPPLSVEESLVGVVVRRQKPMQVTSVQSSGRYQQVDIARREGLISLLSVPLVFAGQSIGVLNVYTGEPHVFSNEEIRSLTALADLSAIALEKARLYERVVDVEEQLRQHEKLSALGLLAAEVAHEIRNPLTVMKMLYHSLDLQFPPDDPRAKDAAIISEKIEHLNRIVEQILDFARSNEPRLAPVNVNQLIDDLSLLTRHKLDQHRIEFIRRMDSNLPAVLADATQLEQACLNLMLNAVEAMPAGGRLSVTTQAAPHEQTGAPGVSLEFRDTGAGMSEEQQARAFSSLLSTTKARGTGLGLAVVHRIVEAHRGEVRIESQAGQGTAIRIWLPVG